MLYSFDYYRLLDDLGQCELNERIKKNILYPTDLLPLLPGEVEQDVSIGVPSYIPSMAQPPTPRVKRVKPRPTVKEADKQREEVLHRGLNLSQNCLGFITRPFREMLLCLCAFVFVSDLGKSESCLTRSLSLPSLYNVCISF